MMILAQTTDAAGPSIPMLPSPPALAHYLLENPWPVVAGLVAAGLVAAFVLNKRGRLKDGVRMLVVAAALAAGVWALSAGVTTEREALQARTRTLVDLTATLRTGELADMLTDRIAVSAPAGAPSPRGKEAVLQAVQASLTNLIQIKEHKIGPVAAVIDGPNVARSQVRVWVKLKGEAAFYEGPLGAWFRIAWTRTRGTTGEPDGPWRVTSIDVLQVDGLGQSTTKPAE